MLDVSRHFMPPEEIRKLLQAAAVLKLNRMHWHLTDDQGWRIQIRKYPLLTETGAVRGDSFFGGTVCVNKNPYIHSRDISKIEMVPRPGNTDFYDLNITLTDRGKLLWSALSITRAENKKIGILVDGMFYRNISPPMLTDNEVTTVYLEGPFDPATAKGLSTNSERNYKIFNDK